MTIPAPMQAPVELGRAFTDPDWLYEIKHDGYRFMAGIEKGPDADGLIRVPTKMQEATDAAMRVVLRTKSGADCTKWFPEIGLTLAARPGGQHVLDGEAVVLHNHRG